jgi:hypothetical protein
VCDVPIDFFDQSVEASVFVLGRARQNLACRGRGLRAQDTGDVVECCGLRTRVRGAAGTVDFVCVQHAGNRFGLKWKMGLLLMTCFHFLFSFFHDGAVWNFGSR